MPEFIPPLEREYFIGSEAECNAFIAKMDTMMGYPNAGVKTDTYSVAREHGAKPGTWYVPLKSVFAPKINSGMSLESMYDEMSPTELGKKITLSNLGAEGAFPKD